MIFFLVRIKPFELFLMAVFNVENILNCVGSVKVVTVAIIVPDEPLYDISCMFLADEKNKGELLINNSAFI